MRKGQQKFISLLLVLMCFLSCINTGTVFARAGTVTDHQAIVLVLDTSGSMDGTPIINLKNAALEFCKKILDSDKNNQIAIVTFASSQKTYDFSNNLTELEQNISSFDASGGTNMANAIKSADTLLQKDTFKNGYAKSIVLCSDGIPQSGGTSYNGQYTNKDSNYYKYANYVYNIAHEIMTKGSNIYTLGFFHNLYGQDLEFANRFMNDIQNGGYFEANNVGDLIDEFVKIAHDILNPFTITLTHEEISYNENTETPGSYTYKYKINASVKNANPKPAKSVKLAINLDEGVILSVGSQQEITIDTLDANDTKEFTWNVELPMIVLGVTPYKEYSVTASSDNTVDITSYDKIIIDTHDIPSPKNNELNFSKDIWNFKNYTVDKIPLTYEDYNAIMHGRSNTDKQKIDNFINQEHGGQCYGMAATTVLSKMKIIDVSDLQEKANSLYDVKKNEKAKSLIGYYYITQHLTEISEEKSKFNEKPTHDKLATIKSLAQNVNQGEPPFILSFSGTTDNEDWGHAVVAYAYEAGNFRKNGRNYSHRILIYDCNYPKWNENSCLYFNEGDSSWCIPNYPDATKLTRALSDLKIMNCSDIETNRDSAKSLLTARGQTIKLIITSISTSKKYSIDGIRTTDLNVFCDDGGAYKSSDLNIVLPYKEEIYNVKNQNGSGLLDLSLKYQNYYMVANSSSCDSADFNPNGSVGIKGNKSDFKISLTGNDGYAPLQWYTISATGANTSNPSLTKIENGYVLNGDNLSDVTITGGNDIETKELTFSTTEDNVCIGESNNELTVSIDKDKDGTYETVIADSGKKNTEKKTAELKNLETENFTLTPTFVATVRDYTSTVDYSVSKVSLTPTLGKGTKATISVNGSKAVAFDGKQAIDLKVGKNKIEIIVSGKNLTNNTYTIIVTRSKAEEIKAQNNINNKTNYTDKSPKTGNYMAKMSLVTAFVLVSLGIILFIYLRFKAKRKKDL